MLKIIPLARNCDRCIVQWVEKMGKEENKNLLHPEKTISYYDSASSLAATAPCILTEEQATVVTAVRLIIRGASVGARVKRSR